MSLTCRMTVGGNPKTLPDGGHHHTPSRECGRVAVAMTSPALNGEASFSVCRQHRDILDRRAERIGRAKCGPLPED